MRGREDLTELKERVKATVTMDDVCHRLGIRIPSNRKIRSIYREEKTPSLHLYQSTFFDYSSGQGGDVIRFVMDTQHWPFVKAVRWLAGQADTSTIRTRQQAEVEEKDADLTDEWRNAKVFAEGRLSPSWIDYCADKWGLGLERVLDMGSKLVVGPGIFPPQLWTPHWHNAKVRAIKVRTLTGAKISRPGSSYRYGLYQAVQDAPWTPLPHQHAVIVEGESDLWAIRNKLYLYPSNWWVYGLPSGASMWRDSWRSDLPDNVYLALDADGAGIKAQDRIAGSLLSTHRTVYQVNVPGGRVAEAVRDKHLGHPDEWSLKTNLTLLND